MAPTCMIDESLRGAATAFSGPNLEEVADIRSRHLPPSLFHYYERPLMLVEGRGCELFDHEGRRYLDCFGGIVTVSVGHCHPKVVAAGIAQMQRLQHASTIYFHPVIGRYAEALAARFPDPLDTVFFLNSGSEANDLAMLMARAHSGNYDVIALQNGYHGGSQATMALSSFHTWKYKVPHQHGVIHAPAPYPYRSILGEADRNRGEAHAALIANLIDYGSSGEIAAFFAESIQGMGGAVPLPDGYLKAAYATVRAAGGLCVADEVQSGWGRSGEAFWAFETQGVVPDIVTLAKGIGNGVPLAAVVTTREIAGSLAARHHFNTFGGNPVSCAQGLAVLDVIEEEGLQANAARRGERLIGALRKLFEDHPQVGEVRGLGLMIGIEFVRDRSGKVPDSAAAAAFHEALREAGVLVGRGGLAGNSLRITPPLSIGEEQTEEVIAAFEASASRLGR